MAGRNRDLEQQTEHSHPRSRGEEQLEQAEEAEKARRAAALAAATSVARSSPRGAASSVSVHSFASGVQVHVFASEEEESSETESTDPDATEFFCGVCCMTEVWQKLGGQAIASDGAQINVCVECWEEAEEKKKAESRGRGCTGDGKQRPPPDEKK